MRRRPHSEESKRKMSIAKLNSPRSRIASIANARKMGKMNEGRTMPASFVENQRKRWLKDGNPMWTGGVSWLDRQEKIAGRRKPEACEICGEYGRICFDHDHATGKFRGWICSTCNVILGNARDSIERFEKLIEYLKSCK